MNSSTRSGFVMLEVLVALAVLSSIVAGAGWLSREYTARWRQAIVDERELAGAENLIAAASLWTVEDLDRRIGPTRQGTWTLVIGRNGNGVYDLVVYDQAARELIRTAVYRDEEQHR